MESSFTFLRVRGIAIGAHWSWLLVVALVVWSLGTSLFPTTYPGLDGGTYLVMAVVAAGLFFGSILLHELGHALRALAEGMRLEGITLWLFGGVARLGGLPSSAGTEFRVAIAGPAVSVVLAALFGVLALVGDRLSWPGAAQGVVDYLARINAIVLAFNLVPALPLDGGRVLRAWLWHRQRSFTGATRSAARVGRLFGAMLVGIGLLGLFTGPGAGGIWLAFIGWFLVQAAQSEAAAAMLQRALRNVRVRDVMRPEPVTVTPALTVAEFLEQAAGNLRFSTYPVVEQGQLRGVVSLRAAGQVPPRERRRMRVGDVMAPPDQVPVVDPERPLFEAIREFRSGPARAVVVEDGRLVGVLSASDVANAVEAEQARAPEREPEARRAGILVWIVVGLALLLAASLLYHPPYVLISPGTAIDVVGDVTISGVPVDPVQGRYLATTVRLGHPTAFGALVAALRTDREVLPLGAVIPPDVSPEDFSRTQQAVFDESWRVVAAAAAQAVGVPVTVQGSGARIVDVLPAAPAADILRSGDVIVALDGQPVATARDVQEAVRAKPVGTAFRLEVERDGQRSEVQVESSRLPRLTGGAGLGVLIDTRDLKVDLPFQVGFRERDVGGPSAGLAYALAIADLLSRDDYARGRAIAATGTIDVEGDVGVVGGVREKAEAAEQAGASVFLVPSPELDAARAGEATVRGVERLDQALRLLAA